MSQRTKEYSSESRGIRFEYDDHWKVQPIKEGYMHSTISITSQKESVDEPIERIVIQFFIKGEKSLIDLSTKYIDRMKENDKYSSIDLLSNSAVSKFGMDARKLVISSISKDGRKWKREVYVTSFLDRAVWITYLGVEEESANETSFQKYRAEAEIILNSVRFNIKNE